VASEKAGYNPEVPLLTVVFICVGNSCRSPIAEAIARSLGGSEIDARSAGLAPAGWIAEPTLTTLEEMGYPTEGLYSKGLAEVEMEDADVVVSLLGEEGLDYLPRWLGARRVAWQIRDPFGEDDETYLGVARQIEDQVRQLLADLSGEELLLT
jgi:arsenate reductase